MPHAATRERARSTLGKVSGSRATGAPRLERDLGKPVLTTNQVSLWHALKMLGAAPLDGLGVLLREHLNGGTVEQLDRRVG